MENNLDILSYSWLDLERAVAKASHSIKHCHIESLVAIARGGSILGTILSYRLCLPIRIAEPDRLMSLNLSESSVLLVDDILNTGATMRSTVSKLTLYNAAMGKKHLSVTTMSIHVREGSTFVPDFILDAFSIPKNTWVIYPWEQNNEK